jgi:hypothetical protein
MLAGRVLYGFYGFFADVLRIARCIVYSPFYLVYLAFGFKFPVAGDVRCNFLRPCRPLYPLHLSRVARSCDTSMLLRCM